MSVPIASLDDTPQSIILGNNIFKRIRNFEIGYHMPYGAVGFRPRAYRAWLTEPAIYTNVVVWFQTAAGWDRFSTHWVTQSTDYEGESGGDWHLEDSFGWIQEFNVRDPPPGNDVRIKSYVKIGLNHKSWELITKITPLTISLLNIGYEVRYFVKAEFAPLIDWVYVERGGGDEAYYKISQAKNIALDVPDSVLKFGLVGGTPDGSSDIPPQTIMIMDLAQYGWDHQEIETLQVNLAGTDYWMLRAGGTNLGTPQPVAQDEEVVF